MAFEISNILNIAGNWWKGAPASVYYDMYQNDNDFDEAATNFYDEAVNNDLGGLGGEDFFADLADQPDDEFLLEKAIYQVDKPDVLMTPYGPALSPDIVASVVQEYPAITALAASPGEETNPDDFYDGWDDYFDEAESFSKDADDEINQIMDAVGDRTMIEGKIGEEPNILQAAGQQISDAFQGFMGLGDDIGLVDNVKGVMSNMADMFKSVQPMAIGMGGSLGTGDAPAPTGMDDQPMDIGGGGGIGDIMTGLGEEQMASVASQPFMGQLAAAASLNVLFEPDPDYEPSIDAIMEELIGGYVQDDGTVAESQSPETIRQWMSLPGWEDKVRGIGVDPEDFRQQLELVLRGPLVASPQPATTTIGPGPYRPETYDDLMQEDQPMDVSESAYDIRLDKPLPHGPETMKDAAKGVQTTETSKKADLGGPPPTDEGEAIKWAEDLRKVFYKRIYAEPGVGRSDVLKELPNVFNQTKAMFLALEGPEMWNNIQVIIDPSDLIEDIDRTNARTSLETNYAAFLENYLSSPAQVLSDPAIRARSMKIARILKQYEDNPNFDEWSDQRDENGLTDEDNYIWISALFGEHDAGYYNRRALIHLTRTGGKLGNYSKALMNSADRVMKYYENIGWSDTEIFRHMMRTPREKDYFPGEEDQPMNVGGDYGISEMAGEVSGDPFVAETLADLNVLDQPMSEGGGFSAMGSETGPVGNLYEDIFEKHGPAGLSSYKGQQGIPQQSFIKKLQDPDQRAALLAAMPEPFDEIEAEKKAKGLPYNQLTIVNGKKKKGSIFVPTIQYGIDEGILNK